MSVTRFRMIIALSFLVMSLVFSCLVRGSDGPIAQLLVTIAFGFLSVAVAWLVFGQTPDQT